MRLPSQWLSFEEAVQELFSRWAWKLSRASLLVPSLPQSHKTDVRVMPWYSLVRARSRRTACGNGAKRPI